MASAFCSGLAFAADTAQFAVIIDATAQMATQFGHQRKIDWVKAAVPPAVKRLGPNASVALWAFGTDPSRKCEAVSELLPFKPADSAGPSMESALASVQPKAGRAPAFEAVRSALKSLGDAGQRQTAVVLVAGTGDDCGKDICASARSLQALYPNAKLFVFGMAMAQPAVESYSCAAKAMGGSFTGVKTGTDLERGLQQVLTAPKEPAPEKLGKDPKDRSAGKNAESLALNSMTDAKGAQRDLAAPARDNKPAETAGVISTKTGEGAAESKPTLSGTPPPTAIRETQTAAKADDTPAKSESPPSAPTDRAPKAQKPAEQPSEGPPTARVPAQPEPNVILSASLMAGAPPLDAGVTWRITKITTSPTGQDHVQSAPIWSGGGGSAKVKLAEGRYEVEAAYGLAVARSEFTVAAAKVEKAIPLDAGMIAVDALQAVNSARAENVLFTLYRSKTGSGREELARSSAEPATFYVNAGDYTLVASAGLAKMETPVTVQAGKVSAVKMALNLGVLEIKVLAADGVAKPVAAWHRLYAVGQKEIRQTAPLLTIEGSSNRLQLPVGTYWLETVYGGVRQDTPVTITAGQVTSRTVILNAGEAKIHIGPDGGKDTAVCAIYEAGSDRKTATPAGRASGTDITFIVKAGLYDVECRSKAGSAAAKETQVKVVAGEAQVTNIAQ